MAVTSSGSVVQEGVLARVMDQIVSCKDAIAQQYLMQCVIQGFPDDFHLGTLDTLLGILPDLQPGVQVHVVVSSLLDRLSRCDSLQALLCESLFLGSDLQVLSHLCPILKCEHESSSKPCLIHTSACQAT